MLTEAMQGAGIFAAVAIPGGLVMWRLMTPERVNLGPGFVDATPEAKRWAEELSPKEPARLRGGTR